jgi:hypothetical protein
VQLLLRGDVLRQWLQLDQQYEQQQVLSQQLQLQLKLGRFYGFSVSSGLVGARSCRGAEQQQ